MRRKINVVGTGTYTISLPKEWVRQKKLRKGDELELTVGPAGELVVAGRTGTNGGRKKKIVFDKHKPWHIRTIISTAYREGYDELEISFKDRAPVQDLKKLVGSLYGFEIIEDAPNIRIKWILQEYDDPREIVMKIFRIIRMQFEVMEKALSNEKVDFSEIRYLRERTLTYRDYAMRIIYSKSSEVAVEHELRNVVFLLDKYGASHADLLCYFLDNEVKLSKVSKGLMRESHELFNELCNAFQKNDEKLAANCYEKLYSKMKEDIIRGEYVRFFQKHNVDINTFLTYFHHIKILFSLASRTQGLTILQ